MRCRLTSWLALASLLLAAASGRSSPRETRVTLQISSPSFEGNGQIPRQHTADGKDTSPPLAWSGVPAGAKSLALIVDDPDAPDPAAPKVVWVHWLLYDIPASATGLPEGVTAAKLPRGTLEGLNDWKRPGWRGPAPPVGRHRYFFKLFALDAALPDLRGPSRAQLEKAMHGHVLAEAQLVGTYARH